MSGIFPIVWVLIGCFWAIYGAVTDDRAILVFANLIWLICAVWTDMRERTRK